MLLDLLLPQRCLVCRVTGSQLCGACARSLPRVRPPLCDRCGAPTAWPVPRCVECSGRRLAFARARAALAYDDAVRSVVVQWKEHGLRTLARTAADLVVEALDAPTVPLAFVPADPDRRRRRGHHPAEALARELGARWQLPVLPLLRRRPGPPQRGLTAPERRANVRAAFVCDEAPARVALVDDVYTTGATASAAASALRRAGARRVEVIALARAVRGYTVRAHH